MKDPNDESKIDFTAPVRMPDGRTVYGCCASAHRVKLAGGINALAANLVEAGMRLGYTAAVAAASGASKTRRR